MEGWFRRYRRLVVGRSAEVGRGTGTMKNEVDGRKVIVEPLREDRILE